MVLTPFEAPAADPWLVLTVPVLPVVVVALVEPEFMPVPPPLLLPLPVVLVDPDVTEPPRTTTFCWS
jgi:hypothetical protein